MSGPLSPQSLSAHNRIGKTAYLYESLKSPIPTLETSDNNVDKDLTTADGPPSSPFQAEVEQENHVPPACLSQFRQLSPSKRSALPVSTFAVHEDDLIDDSLIIYSPHDSPVREIRATASPSAPVEPMTRIHSTSAIKERDIVSFDEGAPPQSLYDIDYSDVPRRQDNSEQQPNTPTVVSEDTCFSTFSAIPNADMTLFANIGNPRIGFDSPRRQDGTRQTAPLVTPRNASRKKDCPSSRSPSPTPRRTASKSRDADTTNLLLDFTQQFEGFSRNTQQSPQRRGGLSPIRMTTDPNLLTYLNNQRLPSPSKSQLVTPKAGKRSLMNLLDFDLPPQSTPRSIPTITARELESLKSSYLSEISSLKASLSGREAEVDSLKKAVTDAERRVGEALETIRDEQSAREHAEKEKSEWEKKGKEVESVLRSVKEEFESAEREREDLLEKLEESNRAREEAEVRAAEAASKSHTVPTLHGVQTLDAASSGIDALVTQRVAQQLDEKMENLARELHAVYKKKHESKVATLKKTYEARSEKKCQELQERVKELERSRADGEISASHNENFASKATEHKAEIEQLQTHIVRLTKQVDELNCKQGQLLHDLEQERAEKGDLVAAVDEMLALQADSQGPTGNNAAVPATVEGFRKSVGLARPSGLRAPAVYGSDSRIGKMGGAAPSIERTSSAKSRMMHNIERMGGGRTE